jgi:hypothetical protein
MSQIEELKQKVKTDTSGKWVQIEELDLFAESIVKECAEVLLRWKGEPFPFDEDLAVSLIKEHFGVEE